MKSVFKFIFVFVICFILCFPVSNVYAYDGDTIDLSPYSSMNMDVYPNSRVSKLYQYLPGIGETFGSSSGSTGFTAEGYMFKNGTPFASPNALYREIIFVNEDDPSPSKAYRQEVISKYNTFLNSNMIASQNGKLRLDYAFYQVNVDYRNISNYAKTSIGRMENGTYRMYMRISDGKQSYLFPLKDLILSDGSSMESKGTLFSNMSLVNETDRDLRVTITNYSLQKNTIDTYVTNEDKTKGGMGFTKRTTIDGNVLIPNVSYIYGDYNNASAFVQTGTSSKFNATLVSYRNSTSVAKLIAYINNNPVDSVTLSSSQVNEFLNGGTNITFTLPYIPEMSRFEIKAVDANGNVLEKHNGALLPVSKEDYDNLYAIYTNWSKYSLSTLIEKSFVINEDVTDIFKKYLEINGASIYLYPATYFEGMFDKKCDQVIYNGKSTNRNLYFEIDYKDYYITCHFNNGFPID